MAETKLDELDITLDEEKAGLRRVYDLTNELPISPAMTRKVAGYIARLESRCAALEAELAAHCRGTGKIWATGKVVTVTGVGLQALIDNTGGPTKFCLLELQRLRAAQNRREEKAVHP